MSKNIIVGVLIAISTLLLCKKKESFEKENNNSFKTSNNIEIGKAINGFINTKNDKDFYKLNVISKLVLNVKLSGIKSVNHSFRIWKEKNTPTLLKWVDDNRKSSAEEIKNFYVEPGTYYFVVLHGERDPRKINKETPYKLFITDRAPETEELEPNDNRSNATYLEKDTSITGFYSPSYNRLNFSKKNPFREEDWYSININLNSDDPVLIDITLSGVPGVNPELYLYNSEKHKIVESKNQGAGEGEQIKNLGITKSGTYYIMVTTKSYNQNLNEQYVLSYILKEFDISNEMENNNKIENANTIINQSISGKIDVQDDIDFFIFNSEKTGSFYNIEIIPPDDLDIEMIIFDYKKKKVAIIDNSKKGGIETIPNVWLSGNFYISVVAKYHAFNKDTNYDLKIKGVSDTGNLEMEPNDKKSNANKFDGNIISGYISKKGDKDFYLLEYNERVKQKFEVTGVKEGSINVMITDPHGYIIKTVEIVDNRTVSFTEMIDRKGYIIVKALKENYNNKYKIILREN